MNHALTVKSIVQKMRKRTTYNDEKVTLSAGRRYQTGSSKKVSKKITRVKPEVDFDHDVLSDFDLNTANIGFFLANIDGGKPVFGHF
jgi:hypothetical protein